MCEKPSFFLERESNRLRISAWEMQAEKEYN